MPTRGNTISGLIGTAVGFIVAIQSSLISHPGLSSLHHENYSRLDFLQGGGPSEWGWPIGRRGSEETAAGIDAGPKAHENEGDALPRDLSDSDDRRRRSRNSAFESASTPERSSDTGATEGVAQTWLRYLKGCYPLAQSCDPRHFWSTPFSPQPYDPSMAPWALEGAIDPTRVVAGPQVPVDPTEAAVPPKVMKEQTRLFTC